MSETTTISIEVSTATAERLDEIARTTEQTTADLARQALDQFLDYEAWKHRAIAEALAEVDAGGPLIAHEDMVRWLESWGTDNELDPPEPTIRR
jgi:predicted transcriptional regulator